MLSYLLWGHWPYYTGASHPDDMLTARLRTLTPDAPLLMQDLELLSQGLEGRSRNPVSVLVDALQLPSADLGADLPPLLSWRRGGPPLDHVVLGVGVPGGVWQRTDGSVLTLSLAAWMALPGLPLREGPARGHRSQAAAVAHYYRDYVQRLGLAPAFRNHTRVTDVRPLPQPRGGRPLWRVEARGDDGAAPTPTVFATPNVVLATGANDRPNRLGALGEAQNAHWVFHDLASFEKTLDQLDERAAPVLVVGAGLSAADAIIAARFRSLAIVHVFRRRSPSLEKQLPENMYPEYHKVQQMMGDGGGGYPCYRALPRHAVLGFAEAARGRRTVTLQAPDGKVVRLRVAAAAVLIGARPDLSFLRLPGGGMLGADPALPVDCRANPVAVDPLTHEAKHAPQGLYALGPLAGDNFVRFILGGAVAVAAHLLKDSGASNRE